MMTRTARIEDAAGQALPQRPAMTSGRLWKALLWQEWLAHGRLIMMGLSLWLIGLWILEIMDNPGWITGFGVIYGMLAATRIAGADSIGGTEEYMFSLPPTRGQRYIVRLALALVPMLLFMLVGFGALNWDLPPRLWGLIADSGLARPYSHKHWDMSWAIVAYPLMIFAGTFSTVAAGGKAAAFLGWLAGLLAFASVLVVCDFFNRWFRRLGVIVSDDQVDWLWQGICWVYIVGMLLTGYAIYVRKEGVPRQRGTRDWEFWLVVGGLLASVLLISLFGYLTARMERPL